MVHEPTQQEVDLWEAWIDTELPGKYGHGTIYIIGEIGSINKYKLPQLRKSDSGHGSQKILHLEILFSDPTREDNLEELRYSEDLRTGNCYEKIIISANNKVIHSIHKIEELV